MSREALRKSRHGFRGRPRTFNMEEVLDTALRVFSEKGYEGTSLTDLTEATGLNRPSLYAAFGNKEALFYKVFERFMSRVDDWITAAVAKPTAKAVVQSLLDRCVEEFTTPGRPLDFFLIHAGLVCGKASRISDRMTAHRREIALRLEKRFESARHVGDLSTRSNPKDLALYLLGSIYALSIESRDGATRNDLKRFVSVAVKAWPCSHI
jgi:AcrR family transcriptional regulator